MELAVNIAGTVLLFSNSVNLWAISAKKRRIRSRYSQVLRGTISLQVNLVSEILPKEKSFTPFSLVEKTKKVGGNFLYFLKDKLKLHPVSCPMFL